MLEWKTRKSKRKLVGNFIWKKYCRKCERSDRYFWTLQIFSPVFYYKRWRLWANKFHATLAAAYLTGSPPIHNYCLQHITIIIYCVIPIIHKKHWWQLAWVTTETITESLLQWLSYTVLSVKMCHYLITSEPKCLLYLKIMWFLSSR